MLAAAVVRAAHVTLSGRLTGGRRNDTVTLTWPQTVVGAVLFTLVAAPALPAAVRAFGPGHWLGALVLGGTYYGQRVEAAHRPLVPV